MTVRTALLPVAYRGDPAAPSLPLFGCCFLFLSTSRFSHQGPTLHFAHQKQFNLLRLANLRQTLSFPIPPHTKYPPNLTSFWAHYLHCVFDGIKLRRLTLVTAYSFASFSTSLGYGLFECCCPPSSTSFQFLLLPSAWPQTRIRPSRQLLYLFPTFTERPPPANSIASATCLPAQQTSKPSLGCLRPSSASCPSRHLRTCPATAAPAAAPQAPN